MTKMQQQPESGKFYQLSIPNGLSFTKEQFLAICQANREMQLEQNSRGEIVIMTPTGLRSSHRNSIINFLLTSWARKDGTGITFDSSGGFQLPNGALRSPDAAWVSLSKWQLISVEDQERFAPLSPDFVIELRSPSDNLATLQEKMVEYIDNGTSLAWLINPLERNIFVYCAQHPVESLENPESISGEPLLLGFILELKEIWEK